MPLHQIEQFLLLPQCFSLLVIGYTFNYKDFPLFDKIGSKSSAAELLYVGKESDRGHPRNISTKKIENRPDTFGGEDFLSFHYFLLSVAVETRI